MVERRFVWCCDALPYPFFTALTNVWSGGENFRLGHWIEGKIGNMLLSEIVRDLCLRAGLTEDDFDVSALDDEVVGYLCRNITLSISIGATFAFFIALMN